MCAMNIRTNCKHLLTKMNKKAFTLFCFLSTAILGQWQLLESGTDASFRSLKVVNNDVIWAGGSKNTVLRSIDGGENWQLITVVDEQFLDFRGIKAFDSQSAIVVSAGLAEENKAKIFKTNDGGQSWKNVFQTDRNGVFLDGIAFFDNQHGLVIGDPIENKPYILETVDGGETWERMSTENLPDLLDGEASFAASNSCLIVFENHVWYALQSRILHSNDRGKSWEILESGFPSGATNGIFGLHFWSEKEGVVVGGDYKDDKSKQINFAKTVNGGKTWNMMEIESQGLKESASLIKGKMVIVGTSGTSISTDSGSSWQTLDTEFFHVVDCTEKTCFAIGANGNLARMKF